MSNIPTAEEYIKLKFNLFSLNGGGELVKNNLIEFTKLHVQAALESASENAKSYVSTNGEWTSCNVDSKVNKESILNSYPLENIK
jgi:hypothetical protein